MNGYELMAKTLRKLAEREEISKEEAEKKCKVYDFLASCDSDDIYNLFDSSAFNEIAEKYTILAVEELIDEEVIDIDQAHAIFYRLRELLDENDAREAGNRASEKTSTKRTKEQINKEKEDEEEI